MAKANISGHVEFAEHVRCGVGVVVAAGTHGTIVIGRGVNLRAGVCLHAYNGEIRLGNRVSIGEHCVVYGHGGVYLEDACAIGPLTFIGSQEHILSGKVALRFSGEPKNRS